MLKKKKKKSFLTLENGHEEELAKIEDIQFTVCKTINSCVFIPRPSLLSKDTDLKDGSPGLNGVAGSVAAATAGIGELTFEDADEEDQFFAKDLPKHACS